MGQTRGVVLSLGEGGLPDPRARSAVVPSAPGVRPDRDARARGPRQAAGGGGGGGGAPGVVHLREGGVFRPAPGAAHRHVVPGTEREGTEPGEEGKRLSPGRVGGQLATRRKRGGQPGNGGQEGVSGDSEVLLTGSVLF